MIVYTSQCNMATRKRKTIGFKTEEELADVVNEIVNDSNSDTDNIPEFSSSEESESESANKSDNESNISIPGPSHRQIDVTPTTGFSENDRQPRIPPFIGNSGMQFAVDNQTDVMSYFDHYVPPELIEIVVDQTYMHRIAKMPRPVTKHARSEEWKPVTVIEMKKFLGLIFVTGIVQKSKLKLYWSTRGIFLTPTFSQTMCRNRFQLFQRYLHFNDNNAAGTNEDRLYKIHTIFDIVVNKFRIIYQIGKFLLMKVCLVGRVVYDFVCITQAKLQSMAYWYGWFVKVQLDIFVTCRFMMANVDL